MGKLLIINPGSTSTKIGVFEDENEILDETIRHSSEEIGRYTSVVDQKDFRKKVILATLKSKGIDIKGFDAIVGRGGLLKPIEGGTYEVNEKMLSDIKKAERGEHASNLGAIIADEIAKEIGSKSFIVDPVVVDELSDVARISGVPELPRTSIFHALNQKAVAKRYAKENNKKYEQCNIIVVHMGGGVSVGAHVGGKVVDVNNALDGDGAFSPERSGGVPAGALIKMCFSGKYTEEEIRKKITGHGGFVAYLDTNDMRDVLKAIAEGNEKAKLIYDAFIYQVSKDIGTMATVLKGNVEAIVLTGGIAYSDVVINSIRERISFIAPLVVYGGEDEMLALAQGALRVLNGEEEVKEYI